MKPQKFSAVFLCLSERKIAEFLARIAAEILFVKQKDCSEEPDDLWREKLPLIAPKKILIFVQIQQNAENFS